MQGSDRSSHRSSQYAPRSSLANLQRCSLTSPARTSQAATPPSRSSLATLTTRASMATLQSVSTNRSSVVTSPRPSLQTQKSQDSLGTVQSNWTSSLTDFWPVQPDDDVVEVCEELEKYYDKGRVFGSGAWGTVQAVKDKRTGTLRAAKTISWGKFSEESEFERQMKIARRLKHPHLVKLYGVFLEQEQVHLVMEPCTGGDLQHRINTRSTLKSRGLPKKDVASYICQMLRGISYLHHCEVAHRDIKPGHYLLQDEHSDIVKLADLTSARSFQKNVPFTDPCGSKPFFAPEMLTAQYSSKCDIWSIGVVSFLLVTGLHPIAAEEYEVNLMAEKPIVFGQEWSKDKELKQMVEEMLMRDPGERPTAKQLMKSNPKLGDRQSVCCMS